jgi:hypothetical protein
MSLFPFVLELLRQHLHARTLWIEISCCAPQWAYVAEALLCIKPIKKNEFLLFNLTVYFEENISFYRAPKRSERERNTHKENDEKTKVSKRISRVHPLT